MKALRLLASLLTLLALLSCVSTPRQQTERSISLVTFNLYHDKADWPQRRELIIQQLSQLNPDVIVLQEVLQHDTLKNQAEDLAAALGYSAYFSSVDPVRNKRRYGNAILSRDPVLASVWTKLRPLEDSRNVAHVRINFHGQPLNIYAVHPNYRDDDEGAAMRLQQFNDTLSFIARTEGDAPNIIAGDFNARSSQPEMRSFAQDYVNAYEQVHTKAEQQPSKHTSLNPHYFAKDARRIDHVYLQRDVFRVQEARIVLNTPDAAGHWPSDHFGVYIRATLSAKPSATR